MLQHERVTIEALLASRRVFARAVRQHLGVVVDMTGDSVLAYFASSRSATICAMEIQRTLVARESSGETPHLAFRIGLCAGQIWIDGKHIYGNAVNRAARIQSLSSPRKVAVTREIYEEYRGLFDAHEPRQIAGLGKPGEPPVRAVEVDPDTLAPTTAGRQTDIRSGAGLRATASVIIVPAAGLESSHGARIIFSLVDLLLRNSFVVRVADPVQCMAGFIPKMLGRDRPREDYFILLGELGGATGNLGLSVFSAVEDRFLFSRGFAAETNGELDAEIATLGFLIGEVIERAESEARSARNLKTQGSFRHYLCAKRMIQTFTKQGTLNGIGLLNKALAIDPDFARAQSLLGKAYSIAWRFDWQAGVDDPLQLSIQHARNAVELDPTDAVCEAELGFTLFWGRERERALMCYRRALQMDPYSTTIAADIGMVYSYLNQIDLAIDVLEKSLRIDALNPDYRLWSLGDAYHSARDYESAMQALLKMRDPSQSYRLLAACAINLGQNPTPYVEKILQAQPSFSVRRWIEIQPLEDKSDAEEFADDLLRAGLPE